MSVKYTIRDIAALAGVSITTVSRYLNGKYDAMSEETRAKISEVIEKSGYRPNKLAQGIKNSETKKIGCVVDDISNYAVSVYIKTIDDYFSRLGYTILLANTDNDAEREQKAIQELIDNQIDGLICITSGKNDDFLRGLKMNGFSVVLLDREPAIEGIIDTVCSDGYSSAYECIAFLKQQGFERIAFFTSSMQYVSARRRRYEGFKSAIKDFYGKDSADLLYEIDVESKAAVRKQLQKFKKDSKGQKAAIFAVNDSTMVTLLKEMKNAGIELDDYGLCCFDDFEMAELIGRGITTIAQDYKGMAIEAAGILQKQMSGTGPGSIRTIYHSNRLVIRGSTDL